MVYVGGIDESGRGPVFGPMVMALVACEDESQLKTMGMKDSKLLSHEQRTDLAAKLYEATNIFHEIISLSPAEIDAAVMGKSQGDNLNNLEARTTALLIFRMAKRVPLTKVILDSPTKTVANYERAVRAALEKIDQEGVTRKIKLVAEIKADFNHPSVSAASILAKTARDAAIEKLKAKHGSIGSGYPADPDTQKYLASQWREPHDFFRKSWESYKRLAEARTQSSLGDFGMQEKHKVTIASFEALVVHGYHFAPPTNQYEVLRMKNDIGVTVISYTTGKVVVQGPPGAKTVTESLLAKLHLMPKPDFAKPGRPRKA